MTDDIAARARRAEERIAHADRALRLLGLTIAVIVLALVSLTLWYVVSIAQDVRRTAEAAEHTTQQLRAESAARDAARQRAEREAQADRDAIDRQLAQLRRDLNLPPAPTYRDRPPATRPPASGRATRPRRAPHPRKAAAPAPRPSPRPPAHPAPTPAPTSRPGVCVVGLCLPGL